jgi:hypothetical protein
MNVDNNILIDELNISMEIKNYLKKINIVASSNNTRMKQTVKDLFIVSPSCKELSDIAKCYEKIITGNGVYPFCGSETYIELAFPSSGKEIDYREFFASPGIVASKQNYFSGVFLVSFELWKGANELMRDSYFEELIKFINMNKSHISFVFHVTPEFENAKSLCSELKRHLNICSLEHSHPNMEQAVEYVKKHINEAGINLTQTGVQELEKFIKESVDVNSASFRGYETLERIASDIQFEIYANSNQKQTGNRSKAKKG